MDLKTIVPIVIVMILTAAYITLKFLQKREELKNTQELEKQDLELEELNEKLPLVIQGEEAAVSWFLNTYSNPCKRNRVPEHIHEPGLRSLFRKAIVAANNHSSYNHWVDPILKMRDDLGVALLNGNPTEQIDLLTSFVRELQHLSAGTIKLFAEYQDIDLKNLLSELNQRVQARHKILCDNRSTKNGFFELMQYRVWIMERAGISSYRERIKGFELPPRPAYWDDLTARFIPNPVLDDFQRTSDLADGEAGLRAAAALRTNDLVEAKFILAICKHSHMYRAEVGDELRTQLIKYVEAENARLEKLEASCS